MKQNKEDDIYIIVACQPDKGIKSYGSKGLIYFKDRRLLEHQIEWIRKNNHKSKICIIADFDYYKIHKNIIDIEIIYANGKNPVSMCCSLFKNKNLCFIDYGCVFKSSELLNFTFQNSEILCCKKDNNSYANLEIGCTISNNSIEHMFFDLPKNKFCNIFTINKKDNMKINNNNIFQKNNLLYFEFFNLLIHFGSVISPVYTTTNFLYFNNMRQKNAINNFITKNY